MATLTHVCMWTDKGWVRVSAEDAVNDIVGKGSVAAHSGLFMCELCGQYVSLIDGEIQIPHFRHSASETSKHCPERSASYSISYNPQKHDLPIRITGVSSSSFRFEVGLIRAPISSLGRDFRIEIKPKGMVEPYIFTKERLNCSSITYLPIGEKPFKEYTLNLKNGSDELRKFWPEKVNGMDPDGTLFDKLSGKKLTYDADVEVKKEYYLLKRGICEESYRDIRIRKIVQKQFGRENWILQEISASAFSEKAAKFFLNLHCRLTPRPVSLEPVWPLFVEGDYIVRHNQDRMYMLVKGDATTVKTFPCEQVWPLDHKDYNIDHPKLYEVVCASRMLISTGRNQVLRYTYLWKEPLNQEGSSPKLSVTDLSGSEVVPGEANMLPHNKALIFKSEFDGELIISSKNHVVDKRKILADKPLELDRLSYGVSVQVVIGLDVVWKIEFKKRQSIIANDEVEILKLISCVSGVSIPAPHSLRNILATMNCYPQICQWIRKCIKDGTINEQSYRRLQEAYRSISKQGDKL